MKWLRAMQRDPFQWHDWFAWYPVTFRWNNSEMTVWWEWLERRRTSSMVGTGDLCGTEYRLKGEE